MRKLALLAAATFAATAVPAAATITIGSQSAGQGQTVQFNPSNVGTTVVGQTNQTNTTVTFSTLTGQTLNGTQSGGQARVQAQNSGGTQVPLTSIDISIAGQTFTYAEFNLFGGGGGSTATSVTVTGYDQFGTAFSQTDSSIGGGQNFFSFSASDNEVITNIQFNTNGNGGFTDLRQLRIDGISSVTTPVPEASTWAMMIVGFGAAGAAMRRGRRRKALLTQVA